MSADTGSDSHRARCAEASPSPALPDRPPFILTPSAEGDSKPSAGRLPCGRNPLVGAVVRRHDADNRPRRSKTHPAVRLTGIPLAINTNVAPDLPECPVEAQASSEQSRRLTS